MENAPHISWAVGNPHDFIGRDPKGFTRTLQMHKECWEKNPGHAHDTIHEQIGDGDLGIVGRTGGEVAVGPEWPTDSQRWKTFKTTHIPSPVGCTVDR